MILPEANEAHQKHPRLSRASLGEWGRNELAITGAPCSVIRSLAETISGRLSLKYNITYADADHAGAAGNEANGTGAAIEYNEKGGFRRLDFRQPFSPFQKRALCNGQDLVLVNGNHFQARCQVVVIHPDKTLEHKLEKLTDVRLILLYDKHTTMPGYLCQRLPDMGFLPVLCLTDTEGITAWMENFLQERVPKLNGLVLAGGKSLRMKADKGSLAYHGKSQRMYMYDLLKQHCNEAFLSCATELAEGLPVIEDRFLGLGPMSGILSALQQDPDAAWLVAACDLPYLTGATIQYLVEHRNPAKTATAFLDPEGRFPEPLIAIWEPRSYLFMLQMLAQGYSCPRKVLINHEVEIIQAPDILELQNVNYPGEYRKAMEELQNKA